MNPYEVLSIPATASTQQIKSAYRKRARQTHPDAGGDGEEFALVSRAYSILIDPEAKKRFDETGSVDELAPVTVRQHMITLLAQMFNEALNVEGQRGTSFNHFNLMEAMRQNTAQNLINAKQQRDRMRKQMSDRQILLKRIVRKSDGENVFANIIKQQLPDLEKVCRQADLNVLALEMANDELTNYKSEVELIQAMQMMQYGGTYSGTAQTNQSVFVFTR